MPILNNGSTKLRLLEGSFGSSSGAAFRIISSFPGTPKTAIAATRRLSCCDVNNRKKCAEALFAPLNASNSNNSSNNILISCSRSRLDFWKQGILLSSFPPPLRRRWLSSSSASTAGLLQQQGDPNDEAFLKGNRSQQQKMKATVIDDGSAVAIQSDAISTTTTVFHAPWLWSNDPAFVHPTSGQKTRTPSSFFITGTWKIQSAEIKIVHLDEPPPPRGSLLPLGGVFSVANSDEKQNKRRASLCVTWANSSSSSSRDDDDDLAIVNSYYDIDWLMRQCRYDDNALKQKQQATKVCRNRAVRRDENLWQVDYNQVMPLSPLPAKRNTVGVDAEKQEETRYQLLHALFQNGAVLVKNAPTAVNLEDPVVASFGRTALAGLSHAELYGETFHVQSTPNANNIAYTSHPLPPHQDLAYYQSKPGFQLLHCVTNDSTMVRGGESTLVDAMAAATELQHLAPDLFEILCQTEATFLKQREGADMVLRRPHIEVDSTTRNVVTAVNWSPPFEGPLSCPVDQVKDYYVAYAAFELMLDNAALSSSPAAAANNYKNLQHLPLSESLVRDLSDYAAEYTWVRRLDPGDILIFNNQRMLHGRRGFTWLQGAKPEKEEVIGRHLIGCYTNMEETLNQYRLLRRERLQQQSGQDFLFIHNAGNGSSSAV